MNDAIYKKIKSLPPMPESVSKIQQICNNPDSGVGDLIAVVEKDPSLTANLLKAANSPLYGFSREIKTVAQAVSLFGMATVKGFAIASAVRSSFKMDLGPYGLDTQTFIRISEFQNSLAVRWYSQVDRQMLDVIAPTSFLLEIGKVIVADYIKKEARETPFKKRVKGEEGDDPSMLESIEEIEMDMVGVTSEAVAANIFEHWNFETLMVESMKHLNNPQDAEPDIQKYVYPLLAVKKAVTIRAQLTEKTIEEAKKVIAAGKLDESKFLASIPKDE